MASSVNSLLGTSPSATSGSAASSASSAASASAGLGSGVPTEGVFLQLLVSQLQNQDPLNPTDSTTFVTQLAQFSELEQVIAIRSDTDTLASATHNSGANGAATATTPTNTTTPNPASTSGTSTNATTTNGTKTN